MLYLGEDNKLHAYPGSKPAEYIIKCLRLNCDQLAKLRHVREFLDSWQKELIAKGKAVETKLANIKEEQNVFLAQTHVPSTQKEQLCLEAMKTMYEMLVITVEQLLSHIDEELRRLNKLAMYRSGSDSTFDE